LSTDRNRGDRSMSNPSAQPLSVHVMTALLTAPYRRGTETLVIPINPDPTGLPPEGAPPTHVVPDYDFNEYRARYGTDPTEPKYILFLKEDFNTDPVDIRY